MNISSILIEKSETSNTHWILAELQNLHSMCPAEYSVMNCEHYHSNLANHGKNVYILSQ